MERDTKESKDQDKEEGQSMNNQDEILNANSVKNAIWAILLCILTWSKSITMRRISQILLMYKIEGEEDQRSLVWEVEGLQDLQLILSKRVISKFLKQLEDLQILHLGLMMLGKNWEMQWISSLLKIHLRDVSKNILSLKLLADHLKSQ